MFDIGFQEMVVILGVALIFFGPKKLPEIGRTLGQTLRELKRASNDLLSAVNDPAELGVAKDYLAAHQEITSLAPDAVEENADPAGPHESGQKEGDT